MRISGVGGLDWRGGGQSLDGTYSAREGHRSLCKQGCSYQEPFENIHFRRNGNFPKQGDPSLDVKIL